MNLLRAPRHWSITQRLVMVAAVPAAMMFVAISVTLYLGTVQEVRSDVQERGRILSVALAQASRYAVVSGDVAHLRRALDGLLAADRSIVAIEIQDRQRRPLVAAGEPRGKALLSQVSPVRTQVFDIDLFDNTAGSSNVRAMAGDVAGYVRVTMSAEPILEAKRRRAYLGAGLVLAMAVFSMLVGLALAQRLRSPLCAVLEALRQIRQGNYDVRLDTRAQGELGLLQTGIEEMAKGLSVKRQELEEQVASRTRELQLAVTAAQAADAEKRRLIAHANNAIEEERQRIAGEIHDSLNASLVSVRLLASSIASKARDEGQDELARIAQRISDTMQELYGSVRGIVKQLRPEVLDALGLKGAVEAMVRTFDEADPNCTFTFAADRDFPVLRGQVAIAAYRAVQEALSNAVKHAEATRVGVSLDRDPEDGPVRITVKDNGKGFDPGVRSVDGGLGLIGMRERVAAVGGRMSVESAPGPGTKITLWLSVE